MNSANRDLAEAWVQLIAEHNGTHAITLCYNNQFGGTSFPCYRVNPDDTRKMLPGSGLLGAFGRYRLPMVRYIPLEQISQNVRDLHGTLDRRLFGRKYNNLPASDRTECVGFVEHHTTNAHIHLSWRVPACAVSDFQKLVIELWGARHPHGSVSVKPIIDQGWAAYICKDKRSVAFGEAGLFVASLAKRDS